MDHCWALNDTGSEKFSTNHDTYGGGDYNWGDGSWADGPKFGTDQAFYFEDCAFTSIEGKHGSLDGQAGMRRVVRHCYLLDCAPSLHGTESGGRQRGARMVETYLNTIDLRASRTTGIQHRAGTGLYWGNTFLVDSGFRRGIQLEAFRQLFPARVWGAANGANPLDNNDTEGDGRYVVGHRPHLYFSGTISASTLGASGLPISITLNSIDGSRNWSGFAMSDTSSGNVDFRNCQNNTANVALITSNKGTTLNVASIANQHSQSHKWSVGDSVVIYRVARASLDQPGMGKADLITGTPPTNTNWPNQQSEPLYSWLNTNNGSNYTAAFFTLPSAYPYSTIKENRDYYQWNTSFDGTTGVGVGLRSARPSTGTKGVGYWATDENTLYVATATNRWSVYYKPYVYPHPLVGGALPGNIQPTAARLRVDEQPKVPEH